MQRIPVALIAIGLGGAAVALAAAPGGTPSLRAELMAAPITPQLGGDTTVVSATDQAFTFIAPNASEDQGRLFAFGSRLFVATPAEPRGSS